jgi:CTP synthase (UTP-ammonia lyase)
MKVDFSERFHEIDELEKHFDEELEEDEEYPFQEDDPLLGINEFPDKNPQHHFYSNSSYHPSSTSSPDKEAKLVSKLISRKI